MRDKKHSGKVLKYALYSILILIIAGVVLSWLVREYKPLWENVEPHQKADLFIKAVGQGITTFGGIVIFLSYLNSQSNTKISERNMALAEDRFKADRDINLKRLASERFSTAITQLGNDTMTVCLGGIFSLENLAADAITTDEQFSIIEVLCYFLRGKTKVRTQLMHNGIRDEEKILELDTLIQASLNAISRCNRENKEKIKQADLSHINLESLTLRGTAITGVNLEAANLNRLTFLSGDMRGSILIGADLRAANLKLSDLRSVELGAANLSTADLSNTYLNATKLVRANLYEVKLHKSCLRLADLRETDLRNSDLSAADLTNANLTNANLQGSNLSNAILIGTKLSGANLREADLKHAKGLEPMEVQTAKNWKSAIFSLKFSQQLRSDE